MVNCLLAEGLGNSEMCYSSFNIDKEAEQYNSIVLQYRQRRDKNMQDEGTSRIFKPCLGQSRSQFDSQRQVIPKTLKIVVMASLFGAQELSVSITTDL